MGVLLITAVMIGFLLLRRGGLLGATASVFTACRYGSKSRYSAAIAAASRRLGVPAEIIEAVLSVESSDGTDTKHGLDEVGVMAIRPATETLIKRRYSFMAGYSSAVPDQAIMLGAGYLRMNFEVGKSWDKAIIMYNSGEKSSRWQIITYASDVYLRRVKERMNRICR